MKRNNLIMISIIFILSFFPMIVKASINAKTTDYLNVRKGPGTNYNAYEELSSGVTVYLIDKTKYSDESTDKDNTCTSGWYKIEYDGKDAYVCSSYVNVYTSYANTTYSTSDYSARVNTSSYITARNLADSSSKAVARLINGTNLKIISTSKISGRGCSKPWLYVSFHDDQKGYVCSSYVSYKTDLTIDSNNSLYNKEYATKLINAGFPKSYIPYLMKMHIDHPSWNFVVDKIDETFDDAVKAERGKNYLQFSNKDYMITNYITSSSMAEVGGWYKATDGVNAYHIDPRNFLNDNFIYMFEELSYNAANQTKDVIKSLFGSSHLSTDTYIGYYATAGSTYNISPVHLAARSIQEGASDKDYGSVSGVYTRTYNGYSLKGYYNYYNIGAYADGVTSYPISRGLAYACGEACGFGTTYGRPWNTRKKAIIYGAKQIANTYVKKGQDTLYFQKFNTSPIDAEQQYTNQYMTNVQAPSSEGENMYFAYKDVSLLDSKWTFIIPVYKDMPDVVSLPTIGDSNTNLSNIKINGTLINNFDEDIVEYTYKISDKETSMELSANTTSSTSTVKGTGKIELKEKEQIIQLIVTSENGDTKTYSITVKKINGDAKTINDIISKLSVKITDSYMTSIKANTVASSLIDTITSIDPNATVKYTNSKNVSLKSSSDLKTGDKIIIISSSEETKTYSIVVRGDVTGDGIVDLIDLVAVRKHLLKKGSLKNAYLKAAEVTNDNKVDLVDLVKIRKYLLKLTKNL